MDIIAKLKALPPPQKCEHGERVGRCDTCLLIAAEKRIAELEAALWRVVDDVLDYERANNLAPNPGRAYCWDSVANAIAVLKKPSALIS